MSNCLIPKAAPELDAIEIGALYHKARESIVDSVKYLIECGKRLRDKRKSLQHGEWLPWLAANAEVLGMNVTSTPQRLMKLATKFGVDAEFDETEAIEWSRQ